MGNRMESPKRPGRAPTARTLVPVVALLATLPFVIVYLDGSVRSFVASVQRGWGMTLATWVSLGGYGLTNATVALLLVAVGHLTHRHREALAGLLGLLAVALGGLAVWVLKVVFCRPRPPYDGAGHFFAVFPCVGMGYPMNSFPSGHSVTSFALAYVCAVAYPRWTVVWYAVATLVAMSRIYLASHFPSDVIAGAAVGLLAGWIVCRLAGCALGDARG